MKRILIMLCISTLLSCTKVETKYVEIVKYRDSDTSTKLHVLDGYGFIPPLADYRISSKFGFRENPMGGDEFNLHRGIDLVGVKNSEIFASQDGIVVLHYPPPNGYFKGHPVFGGVIIIQHNNGVFTLYGHLKESFVNEGQSVKRGDVIGIQGSTGTSTGDHLHFEILFDPILIF